MSPLSSTMLLIPFVSIISIVLASSTSSLPPYIPHQIKDYQYCLPNHLNNLYEIDKIYVINTMNSFDGILIGKSLVEISCGEIHLTQHCHYPPFPPPPPLPMQPADLCDYTECPIQSNQPSLISFHSSSPLPSKLICDLHLEIMQGSLSSEKICQNFTMVTCVHFNIDNS